MNNEACKRRMHSFLRGFCWSVEGGRTWVWIPMKLLKDWHMMSFWSCTKIPFIWRRNAVKIITACPICIAYVQIHAEIMSAIS